MVGTTPVQHEYESYDTPNKVKALSIENVKKKFIRNKPNLL